MSGCVVWPGLRGIGIPSASQWALSLSSSFLHIPGPEISLLSTIFQITNSVKSDEFTGMFIVNWTVLN